ncbi:CapA family protein [Xylanibacillus composti]|nr:CapA family protein [Xylanibacillus composti]
MDSYWPIGGSGNDEVASNRTDQNAGTGNAGGDPADDAQSGGKAGSTPEVESPNTDDEIDGGEEGIASGKEIVRLAFVGDVLLGSTVSGLLENYGYDYPYTHVKELLQKPDLTVANLETPITDRGEPVDKTYVYRSSPQALPAFKEAGFDVVNLANNHILDFGAEGLLDTLQYLKEAGIYHVGAGKNGQEAFAPVYVDQDGIRVAFLGFSHVVPTVDWKARNMSEREPTGHPGVADTYDYTRPVETIAKASEQADLVIVLVHWGVEREESPRPYQVDLARRYIDAGADLIVGSHPHVLQSFEQYNGKWIAYSLGNFIFTTNDNPRTWESSILEAACTKDGECELHITPVLTKAAQPVVMEGEEGRALLSRLDALSDGVRIETDGRLVAER